MHNKAHTWWQSPRRAADRISNRSVTFLELFYDLVFVIIISETAHRLSSHLDGHGLIVFAGMFTIIWWAWFNGSLYHDVHGNNDLRTRVFTFLQMIAVAAMAVFAHEAVGDYSAHFALSYAALQLILAYLWFMTGISDPDHRPLSMPYTINMLISVGLFVASVFVSEDLRYTLWLIAMIISMVGSQTFMLISSARRPEVREQMVRSSQVSESLVERFGLFTIIVLGEVIVGVVRGVIGHHHLDWVLGATAFLGLLIAIGLWWNYFDFISLRIPKAGIGVRYTWMWLHLPMTMGIAATGAATLYAVEHSPETPDMLARLILGGSVFVTIISIGALGMLLEESGLHNKILRVARWYLVASAILAVGLSFTGIEVLPLLACLVLLLMAPVVAGFVVFVRNPPADQSEGGPDHIVPHS